MNRGIIKLTKVEFDELMRNFDIKKYASTPLYSKFSSVYKLGDVIEVEILLSSDELEIILDEIGFVNVNTNPVLNSVFLKLSNTLRDWLPD